MSNEHEEVPLFACDGGRPANNTRMVGRVPPCSPEIDKEEGFVKFLKETMSNEHNEVPLFACDGVFPASERTSMIGRVPPCSPEEDKEKEFIKDRNGDNNNDKSPEKYSQAYFEDRIQSLRTKILQTIPNQDDLVPPPEKETDTNCCVFGPVLRSLEAAKHTLDSTKAVKKVLQTEQKNHPEDDGWKDSSLLDPVQQALKEAQATVDGLEEAATNAGCAVVRDSGLLDEDDHDHDHGSRKGSRKNNARGCATTTNSTHSSSTSSMWKMERDILECTVLVQATPKKLADWCAESPGVHRPLLDRFLGSKRENGSITSPSSTPMMATFLEAGGPSHGNYGTALVLYDKLREELRIAKELEIDSYHPFFSNVSCCLRERLALAVALELATPILIFKQTDTFVDPVERFRYYAKFSCVGDDDNIDDDGDALDKAFSTLSVWELRKVVNANATHDDLTWGRQFLRNYRPDQIYTKDQKWRYVMAVKTDVGYRHPDHDFHNYQELLSAGGECGPRAFFGRFISKAWGLPTWGVRQPGHAAMTRWTNNRSIGGWTVCLGADWPYSWWEDDRYGGKSSRHGPDFLEETQARTAAGCVTAYYKKVVMLECLAESLGETVIEDFSLAKIWRSLALAQRKMLARAFVAPAAPAPADIASEQKNPTDDNHSETNVYTGSCICKEYGSICHESPYKQRQKIRRFGRRMRAYLRRHRIAAGIASEQKSPTDDDHMGKATIHEQQAISIQSDGTIIIPAASFVDPKKPSRNVLVMKSFLGGDQLHLEHDGAVEYELPSSIPTGGTFALSVKVVNVHRDQKPLQVHIENSLECCDNDDDTGDNHHPSLNLEHHDMDGFEMIHLPQGQELKVQYTKGVWEETKSIRVDLNSGGRLKLSRKVPCWGLSIKEIVLRPI